MSRYAAYIAAGVALLDERHPGWRNIINIDSLNMEDADKCILGQVYGNYGKGLDTLGLDSGRQHGFYTADSEYDPEAFSELTTGWREELAKNTQFRE